MSGDGREEGWFTGAGGRPIFHRARFPARARGIALVVHGLSEHSGRYAHVLDHLAEAGLAGFAQDHRGHGRSARTLGDIESLDDVLADLAILHRDALTRLPGLPVFLVGHSLGGLISTLYLERTPSIAGAVINAPALDVPDDVPGPIRKAAGIVAKFAPRLALQPFYDPESLTHDAEVVARVKADPLFYKGKVRARTGAEILRAIPRAIAGLGQIRQPLLATHGAADRTVPVRASEALVGGVASRDKQLHLFDGMLHEVHNEPGRAEVLARWSGWIGERL